MPYTVMYVVPAYAVTSFVRVQPMWGQRSEGEDPEALFSPLCVAPVHLLNPPHLQVLHSVVCGPVCKSVLQLVFPFSLFLCQSCVHSS